LERGSPELPAVHAIIGGEEERARGRRFGALAALLAQLLTVRKLRRMDVSSTLHVME
jgi:hypothetical protein